MNIGFLTHVIYATILHGWARNRCKSHNMGYKCCWGSLWTFGILLQHGVSFRYPSAVRWTAISYYGVGVLWNMEMNLRINSTEHDIADLYPSHAVLVLYPICMIIWKGVRGNITHTAISSGCNSSENRPNRIKYHAHNVINKELSLLIVNNNQWCFSKLE